MSTTAPPAAPRKRPKHPVDEVPPPGKLVVYGIQHLLAFYDGKVVLSEAESQANFVWFDLGEDRSEADVLRGLSMTGTDERTLALSGPLFDGLYEYHRRRTLLALAAKAGPGPRAWRSACSRSSASRCRCR